MDPLSIIASSAAIFDSLKAAYRFAEDWIKADDERAEFAQRFDCVKALCSTLDHCIEVERDQPGHAWVKVLIPDDPSKSPLLGLQRTMNEMVNTLQFKGSALRQKLKNFKWHSEKKSLEGFFTAIATYSTMILGVLNAANIGISRDTNTIVKGIVVSLEQGWEEQKKLQEERKSRQEEKRKYQEQKAKFREEERKRLEEEKRLVEEERRVKRDEKKRREEEQKRADEQSDRKYIQPWLSPLDFRARQRTICRQSYRTGQWFLQLPAFDYWKQGQIKVLRCFGPAGAGKTVLSSIIVDHLLEHLPPQTPVLCMFLEKKPIIPYTPDSLVSSLLRQLVEFKRSSLSAGLRDAYNDHKDGELSQHQLLALFKAEIETYDRVHLVVDGVDEINDNKARLFVDRDLHKLFSGKLRLMYTARRDEDPTEQFIFCDVCKAHLVKYHRCIECFQASGTTFDLCPACLERPGSHCLTDANHSFKAVVPDAFELRIEMPPTDLRTYVQSFIEEEMPVELADNDLSSIDRLSSPLGWECYYDKQDLFVRIVDAIVEAAQGRFLLAKLYTNSLNCQPSLRDIEDAITEMQQHRRDLSETIDVMYEKDMNERIKGQEPDNVKFALQVLSVVSCARRNLRLDELQHVLATRLGDSQHYPKGIRRREQILHVTKGLITIETDLGQIVRFDHLTLADYLHRTREKWFPEGEIAMANVCLTYLSFDTFSKPCTVEVFTAKETSHPFLSYAVQFWGDHVRKAGPQVHDAAIRYLKDPSRVEAYVQCAWAADTKHYDKWDVRKLVHPLHIYAWFDLWDLISALDYQNLDLSVQEGTYGQTPLMYACRRGHLMTTLRLLELGAKSNIQSGKGRTALFEAVLRIRENSGWKDLQKSVEIINVLLNLPYPGNEVDVNVPNPKLYNRTALMMAIYHGHAEMALPLIRHPSININQQDARGYTALSLAVLGGMTDIVKEILEFDEILVDTAEYGVNQTALMLAAERNHHEIVELLLRRGAQPNLRNSNGKTAILRAVEEGSLEAVLKMTDPEWETNLFCVDEDNRTLFHGAAEQGSLEILQTLHEKGLPSNARDAIGMTPLHVSCRAGKLDAARRLLDIGADSSIKDKFGRTPFIVSFQYGKTELMDLCKNGGNNVENCFENLGPEDLPVWSLVFLRDLQSLTTLISRGAALDCREPGTANTLLHLAVLENANDSKQIANRLDILRQLLVAGKMSPDVRDKYGHTPLHIAALEGSAQATEMLLEHDAKFEELDRFRRTPLMIASMFGNSDVALILINAGAKVDEFKVDIDKLLLAAVANRNVKAMEHLLQARADRLAQDDYGRTTDLIARQVGGVEILRILQGARSFVYRSSKAKTMVQITEVEVPEEAAQAVIVPFRSPALGEEQPMLCT